MSPRNQRTSSAPSPRNFQPDRIIEFQPAEETTLLPFLESQMPDRKRANLKTLLKHNHVAVNGIPQSLNSFPLVVGDRVEINIDREFRVFSNRRVRLVYEDSDILVIEKGYGLLSMATERSKGQEETAYTIMREWIKWTDPRQKLFIVHRLDQNTTGLMMMAKTIEAKEAMQHNWNNMVLNRKYIAVVEGYVADDNGVIQSYLAENSAHEVYSTKKPEEGKLAITRYKVIKRGQGHTMLEVELDTGRKNQIRVHLKELGHPIAGDRRYGARPSIIHRLALHAQTLRFVHPITRREMNFSTPIPGSFYKLTGGK